MKIILWVLLIEILFRSDFNKVKFSKINRVKVIDAIVKYRGNESFFYVNNSFRKIKFLGKKWDVDNNVFWKMEVCICSKVFENVGIICKWKFVYVVYVI